MQFDKPPPKPPVGPTFTYEQLEILASGKISQVFGVGLEDVFQYEVMLSGNGESPQNDT